MREHEVTALTAAELEATRRELAASLALARLGSPVCAPIQAHLAASASWLVNPAATRARRSSAPRNAAGLLAGSCMRHPSAGRG